MKPIATGDVNAAKGYFRANLILDIGFYMKYTVDKESSLQNIFSADSTGRSIYDYFGELLHLTHHAKKIKT